MRKRLSIATGALVATVLAHGLVYSALDLNTRWPNDTYYGFCRNVLLAIESMWSRAHGWPPFSHIEIFGGFYANVIHIACPLIGFLAFRLLSRDRIGWTLWKPLLIVSAGCPLNTWFYPAIWEPWSEMMWAFLIFGLMAWSVGGLPAIPRKRVAASEPAPASA
ncbi:MAG: hypothetical protein JST11_17955 [Acidobacteria bacterium]|nr:hypothetical protein [Acidobacteriota bacterium]